MKEGGFPLVEENKSREFSLDLMMQKFIDYKIPYKIRKTNLLKDVGLPIPRTSYFEKDDLKSLQKEISEELGLTDNPLIVRLACIPDKYSMPTLFIEKEADNDELVNDLYLSVKDDSAVKYYILQEATSLENAKKKISGRISFEKSSMMPIQEVVEIYKGARSTGVLNSVDIDDPNFQRYIKKAGEFMKPAKELSPDSTLKEDEIREMFLLLNNYQSKLEMISDIINKSQNKSMNSMTISFEFSCVDGKFIFSDIDF